jgi:enterochelin esterase-like enzyme
VRHVLLLLAVAIPMAAQTPTISELRRTLHSKPADARSALVAAFGEESLTKGTAVLYEGGDFAFALLSDKEPKLVIDEGAPRKMHKLGEVWLAQAKVETSRTHNFHYLIDGEVFGGLENVPAFGPYSYETPGVPKGTLSEQMVHESRLYPGMKSNWWIYVPAQYDASKPAAVMLWHDGEKLVEREVSRAQIVFDNLTHEKKIPVIVHVMVSPGTVGDKRMRSILYDTVDHKYPRFWKDEILVEVAKKYNIRRDAYSRAIAGDSSGGISSFNAAWQMPGEFSRVLCRVGSFTSIQWHPGKMEGGNVYPFKVRKEPKRNIRVWLQDGSGDLENEHGSWPLQNIQIANSLKMEGYDFHLSWGNGSHSRMPGNAELAEELTWLWRDYDPAKTEQTFVQDPAEKAKPMFRIKALNRE